MKKKRLLRLILVLAFIAAVVTAAVIYHRTTPDAVHTPTFAATAAESSGAA